MKIIVGSKNTVKIEAVRELLQEYLHLTHAVVEEMDVASGVGDQPLSLEETVEGAMNRARDSFADCDYSIGIESGLMAVPGSKSGHMDVCVCTIYDGAEFHLGLSSAWEAPKSVMEHMLKGGST